MEHRRFHKIIPVVLENQITTKLDVKAYLIQLFLNLLYEERVIRPPNDEPRE